jgi:hypothetical protein
MGQSRKAPGYKDRKGNRGKCGNPRPGAHEGGTWWAMLAELGQIAKRTKAADRKKKMEKSEIDAAISKAERGQ